MKNCYGGNLCLCLVLAMILSVNPPLAVGASRNSASTSMHHLSVPYSISSSNYPVILKGESLSPLLGVPVGKIFIYTVHEGRLKPVPFQIDRRDRKGEFQIPLTEKERKKEGRALFDENDECVFMTGDVGRKMEAMPGDFQGSPVVEIEITDPRADRKGWVYAFVVHDGIPERTPRDYISYDLEHDAIETDTYRIAFSKKVPFLVSTLTWKRAESGRYSPNLADVMKVRHRGKLFHKFDFLRTQDDYTSKVVAVKDGPVRVIRRTANRVRILWNLRTPSIFVDYICYRNAFNMDTLVDIPFRIGWFFSDVETLMTMDGNDDPAVPRRKVYSRSTQEGFSINGMMSNAKNVFNASGETAFVVASSDGLIVIGMDIEKDFPIQYRAYLMDDKVVPDPPENIPGQFGNLGFLTTNWEALDTSLHHMIFSVYMVRNMTPKEGLELLTNAPSFVE